MTYNRGRLQASVKTRKGLPSVPRLNETLNRKACNLCRILSVSAALLSLCVPSALSLRKDEVVMSNGDRLTGEVKHLQNALLYLETEYVSDNIPLDWSHIVSVKVLRISKLF